MKKRTKKIVSCVLIALFAVVGLLAWSVYSVINPKECRKSLKGVSHQGGSTFALDTKNKGLFVIEIEGFQRVVPEYVTLTNKSQLTMLYSSPRHRTEGDPSGVEGRLEPGESLTFSKRDHSLEDYLIYLKRTRFVPRGSGRVKLEIEMDAPPDTVDVDYVIPGTFP